MKKKTFQVKRKQNKSRRGSKAETGHYRLSLRKRNTKTLALKETALVTAARWAAQGTESPKESRAAGPDRAGQPLPYETEGKGKK